MKKFYKVFTSVILVFLCVIGVLSLRKDCDNNDYEILVDEALDEADVKIDDYFDVCYFANLEPAKTSESKDVQALANSLLTNEEENNYDEIQYETLTTSIIEIFNDLSDDEYAVFEELAQDDNDIAQMLEMIENNFDEGNSNNEEAKMANVIQLSAGVATIGSLLAAQRVCSAAITIIKGAFNSMIATLKAFFVPNVIKGVLITASILTISTVVVINWNKIKPIFNKILNVFVENAKKLASTVTKVFNRIWQLAASSVCDSFEDVINKNSTLSIKLKKVGGSLNEMKKILTTQLHVPALSTFYNSKNKTLCIGRDTSKYDKEYNPYAYQNYAKNNNYWSFWSENYDKLVADKGEALVNFCNEVLIYYCCYNNWDFVLITNPYHYMAEHPDTRYGGKAYANEISIIRSNNYIRFTNGLTWNTIPNPGLAYDSYFVFAGYKVTKGVYYV